MKDFSGKVAVITGGGTGMGRELARQLAAEGCHIGICDVSDENMAETAAMIAQESPTVTVSTSLCDVADEAAVLAFRDDVLAAHGTDHVNLVFNNAGLSGGGSLFEDTREAWDRCFAVCWGGVYNGTRAFLPLLAASDDGYLVNTSSVNGFWASLGPERAHTAYSAAKFAVKGFTEALINDCRLHAPHVKVAVVMPGHIGTDIVANSMKYGASEVPAEFAQMAKEAATMFRENAPLTAAEGAAVILQGVREERWRILVGDDAHALDTAVREDPEAAYEGAEFLALMRESGGKDPEGQGGALI